MLRIREIRLSREPKKMTLEELSGRTGITPGLLSRYEREVTPIPMERFGLIAQALEVEPHELIASFRAHERTDRARILLEGLSDDEAERVIRSVRILLGR